MAKSFFRVMQTSSKDEQVRSSIVYQKLNELLLQGGFTNSEVEQFICKNYLLSVPEITRKWNLSHTKQKKELTFYGQVSVLSNKFFKLFKVNADEFEIALLSCDMENEVLNRIYKILTAIGVSDELLVSQFDFTLKEYLADYEPKQKYSVSDCTAEMSLLKLMSKQNLLRLFAEVDIDKLAYLYQSMSQDLISSEAYEFERKDKRTSEIIKTENNEISMRKVLYPVVNEAKMELCIEFAGAKPKRLQLVKEEEKSKSLIGIESNLPENIEVDYDEIIETEENLGATSDEVDISKDKENEVENSKYSLGITQELINILETGIKVYENLDKDRKAKLATKSTEETRQACESFFKTLTADGFTDALNKLKLVDVVMEVEKYRK